MCKKYIKFVFLLIQQFDESADYFGQRMTAADGDFMARIQKFAMSTHSN